MITINDLAKLANVSKSTVSKALNDRPDVSADTKAKIQKLAERHKFTPNGFGKSLKSRVTNNIGVIFTRENTPLSHNPFFSRILEGIESELAINNFNLILNIIPETPHQALPKMIRERTVDGIILIGVFSDSFIESVLAAGISAVQVDPKRNISGLSQVFIDNEHGAFLATKHLIEAGHKRIGFICADISRLSFAERLKGYLKALKHCGLEADDQFIKSNANVSELENGYDQVKDMIEKNQPTAIFVANDINALYGYQAARDLGLEIAEDISFVAFDDIWSSKFANPPLTTVRVYKEELGSIGVRILLQTINGEITQPANTIVPVKLIERKSVRIAPIANTNVMG